MAGMWDWNHATAADPSTWQHPNPSPGLFTQPPPQLPPLPPTFGTILDLNSPAFDFDGTLQDLNAPAFNFDQPVEGLRFLLQKELRNSDVSSLGRIVLPKKGAESHLPVLEARDGILLPMHDMVTSEVWPFRYRFWPNLKSRMYILENTAEFVKTHDLHLGDFIMIYKDDSKNRYIIRANKKIDPEQPLTPVDDEIFDSIMPDIAMASARYSDIFSPLADDTNKAFDLNYDFSANFPLSFPDERVGSSSAAAESLPRISGGSGSAGRRRRLRQRARTASPAAAACGSGSPLSPCLGQHLRRLSRAAQRRADQGLLSFFLGQHLRDSDGNGRSSSPLSQSRSGITNLQCHQSQRILDGAMENHTVVIIGSRSATIVGEC